MMFLVRKPYLNRGAMHPVELDFLFSGPKADVLFETSNDETKLDELRHASYDSDFFKWVDSLVPAGAIALQLNAHLTFGNHTPRPVSCRAGPTADRRDHRRGGAAWGAVDAKHRSRSFAPTGPVTISKAKSQLED